MITPRPPPRIPVMGCKCPLFDDVPARAQLQASALLSGTTLYGGDSQCCEVGTVHFTDSELGLDGQGLSVSPPSSQPELLSVPQTVVRAHPCPLPSEAQIGQLTWSHS